MEYWIIDQRGHTGKTYHSHRDSHLLPTVFPIGTGLCEFFPSMMAGQLVLPLHRSYLGNHTGKISWMQYPYNIYKAPSSMRHPGPLALTLFCYHLQSVSIAFDLEVFLL